MVSMKEIRASHTSWRTFLMVINRLFPETPPEIIRALQLQLHQFVFGELRETYLKGLPKLLTSDKLEMPLEDIINPIEKKETLLITRHWGVDGSLGDICHPGRLSLIQDWKFNTSDPEDGVTPIESWGRRILQDRVYFIGGRPLIFWKNFGHANEAMGLKICPPDIHLYERHLMLSGYRWKTSEELQAFKLLPHLEDEYKFWKNDRESVRSIFSREWDHGRPPPRTYWGGSYWIQRHRGGKTPFCPYTDGYNDPYVWYLQWFEDTWRAAQPCGWTAWVNGEGKCYGFFDDQNKM